jgi:hypothetical protein
LSDATNAVNGIYDLRFGLHSARIGGVLVAGPLTNTATPASNLTIQASTQTTINGPVAAPAVDYTVTGTS